MRERDRERLTRLTPFLERTSSTISACLTSGELATGFRALGVDLYSAEWTERRRRRFNERLRAQRHREKEGG